MLNHLINDYLKACANRTMWAVKGDINEEILQNYYKDLEGRWKSFERVS